MKEPACNKEHNLTAIIRLTSPVFFAYFPLGIVFSLLFVHLGFAWYLSPIMCLFVYGGSVQFVAIGIMAAAGSYLSIVVATIFLALRNTFYGIHFVKRFNTTCFKKLYLFFSLVDANYVILMSHPEDKDKKKDIKFCLKMGVLIHAYWVSGAIVTLAIHCWKRSLIISILSGTAFFLILQWWLL